MEKMPVVVTSFSNDESTRPPTLQKTESTTKFQNNYFKEHPEGLLFYKKHVF